MKTLSIDAMDLKGKRVLTRVDFNVPLDGQTVTDDTRIRAALPTIQHIIDAGGRAVLMSHCGRPKGQPNPDMSLAPAAKKLMELLGKAVKMTADCIGEGAVAASKELNDGEVLLLENLRFHKGETDNDAEFAKALAENGDVGVCDIHGLSWCEVDDRDDLDNAAGVVTAWRKAASRAAAD